MDDEWVPQTEWVQGLGLGVQDDFTGNCIGSGCYGVQRFRVWASVVFMFRRTSSRVSLRWVGGLPAACPKPP